jgi:hypothetical protein
MLRALSSLFTLDPVVACSKSRSTILVPPVRLSLPSPRVAAIGPSPIMPWVETELVRVRWERSSPASVTTVVVHGPRVVCPGAISTSMYVCRRYDRGLEDDLDLGFAPSVESVLIPRDLGLPARIKSSFRPFKG